MVVAATAAVRRTELIGRSFHFFQSVQTFDSKFNSLLIFVIEQPYDDAMDQTKVPPPTPASADLAVPLSRWTQESPPEDLEGFLVAEASAEQLLESLLRRAVRHKNADRRLSELTALERLLTDKNGYLEQLRERRTEELIAQREAGTSVTQLAKAWGVTPQRMSRLLKGNRNYVRTVSDEDREQIWQEEGWDRADGPERARIEKRWTNTRINRVLAARRREAQLTNSAHPDGQGPAGQPSGD